MSPVIALHPLRVALPPDAPAALQQGLQAAGCTVLAPSEAGAGTDWVLCSAQEWAELQAARQQLDERRWTERAKGVLMQCQQLEEAQAYKLLRDAAMQAQTKLSELARHLVQQHERAEALERAGAQRMLSQRLLRLQAQALLGLEPAAAAQLQAESAARIEANLMRLHELLHGPLREALGPVQQAWAALQQALANAPCAARLSSQDAAAQQLLDASETLVAAITEAGQERPPRLLVLCTRQRLLSQRLVKEALLAQLDPAHDPQRLALGLDEFLRALQTLRNAPLHSPGLQAAFDAVDREWDRLLRGLRQGHGGGPALRDLCERSERLLQALDALTQVVQRSLQTLLS